MKNLSILNPSDKTRFYTVASGEGAPAAGDRIVEDTKLFGIASTYVDTTNKKFYVRMALEKKATDWTAMGAATASE